MDTLRARGLIMLQAIVLHLRPVAEASLPVSHGAYAYAAALDLLLRVDAALAGRLHGEGDLKPLTVSPLLGLPPAGREVVHLIPETPCYWRLTGLDAATSDALCRLEPGVGGVRMGEAIFAVSRIDRTREENAEAGRGDYAALLKQWVERRPPESVRLRFLTPTTFRMGAVELPFPLPRLVFGSLARQWDAWAPTVLGDCRGWLDDALLLSNWHGETRRVEMGSRRTVGFIGDFTYRSRLPIREVQQFLGLLSDFAFWAGVGWQTTCGLGQTRWVEGRRHDRRPAPGPSANLCTP